MPAPTILHRVCMSGLFFLLVAGFPLPLQAVNPVQINDHDLRLALQWSIHCMSNVQNPQDRYIPYFDCYVLQDPPYMLYNAYYSVPVNAGKILKALLKAEAATGFIVDPIVIQRYRQVVFDSFSPVPGVCAAPDGVGAPYNTFWAINGHAMRALATLVESRNDLDAGTLMEQGISNLKTYFVDNGYNWAAFREHFGLPSTGGILGKGWPGADPSYGADSTCILAFLEYYQVTGYAPALEMCLLYAKNLMNLRFPENGALPANTYFMLGPTREMNALARVALEVGDATMMTRARARYENGLRNVRSLTGWVPENLRNQSDTGEINTTGELAETAMVFGDWGWTQYYQDAELFTCSHILPAQLLDNSFVASHMDPADSKNNVKERAKGAFGFPAPYGHVATMNPRHQGAFHMDIVAGAAISLADVFSHAYNFINNEHFVSMLFDIDNDKISIKSPYPSGNVIQIVLKTPGVLHVHLPSWVDHDDVGLVFTPAGVNVDIIGDFLKVSNLSVNVPVSIRLGITYRSEMETINGRTVSILWRGDSIGGMSQMNCPLPFFPEANEFSQVGTYGWYR
jgi:hypothetical protein